MTHSICALASILTFAHPYGTASGGTWATQPPARFACLRLSTRWGHRGRSCVTLTFDCVVFPEAGVIGAERADHFSLVVCTPRPAEAGRSRRLCFARHGTRFNIRYGPEHQRSSKRSWHLRPRNVRIKIAASPGPWRAIHHMGLERPAGGIRELGPGIKRNFLGRAPVPI